MAKRALVGVGTVAIIVLAACGPGGGGRRPPPGFGPPGMGMGPMLPPREETLRRFDANADMSITTAEFDAVLASDYRAADADGDGKLGAAEVRTINDRLSADTNTSPILDWNGDGQVSIQEYGAQWRSLFVRSDRNEDGVISEDELTRPMMEPPKKPRGMPPGGMPPGGGPPGGGRPGG
jgi:Ca2+-binding EF-hand superfamily protein